MKQLMKPFIAPIIGHMHNREYLARIISTDAVKNHLREQLPPGARALLNESTARLHARFPNLSAGYH